MDLKVNNSGYTIPLFFFMRRMQMSFKIFYRKCNVICKKGSQHSMNIISDLKIIETKYICNKN